MSEHVRTVLDEWGAFGDDEDFAEAIRDSGAWRLARDLRAALDADADRLAEAWHKGYQRGRDALSQMNPYRD